MNIKTDIKMMKYILVASLCTLLAFSISCKKESPMIDATSSEGERTITFFAGNDEVSVLIFQKANDDIYKYIRSISSGWINNRVSTELEIGNYKFLFIKSPGLNTSNYPDELNLTVPFENIKIFSLKDPANNDYVLPVDEIWLPKTYDMANTNYAITGPRTVQNTLTRAISQPVLKLKRASSDGNKIDSLPYQAGENIMQHIEEIKVEIDGVGKYIDIEGGKESAKTKFSFTQETSLTDEGFADFLGPFVFPTENSNDAEITITIIPKDTSPFEEMSTTVSAPLERNRRLEITIWLTSTYRFIGVDVDIEPITSTTDGDTGMWE